MGGFKQVIYAGQKLVDESGGGGDGPVLTGKLTVINDYENGLLYSVGTIAFHDDGGEIVSGEVSTADGDTNSMVIYATPSSDGTVIEAYIPLEFNVKEGHEEDLATVTITSDEGLSAATFIRDTGSKDANILYVCGLEGSLEGSVTIIGNDGSGPK